MAIKTTYDKEPAFERGNLIFYRYSRSDLPDQYFYYPVVKGSQKEKDLLKVIYGTKKIKQKAAQIQDAIEKNFWQRASKYNKPITNGLKGDFWMTFWVVARNTQTGEDMSGRNFAHKIASGNVQKIIDEAMEQVRQKNLGSNRIVKSILLQKLFVNKL